MRGNLGRDSGGATGAARCHPFRVILAVFLLAAPPIAVETEVPDALYRAVAEARVERQVPALRRDPRLDEVARKRARETAALPQGKRFSPAPPIEKLVREAGIRRFARVWDYLAYQGGYADVTRTAIENWKAYERGWSRVVEPEWGSAGFAAVWADDGTLVVCAVLLEPAPELPPLDAIETKVFQAINRERTERGLAPLVLDPALSKVARAHSEEMLKANVFDHRGADGSRPADRVSRAGIAYRRLAENIAENLGAKDPAGAAVMQWMTSVGHRENVLDPRFTHTGVGVAANPEEGELAFTQLFLLPPEEAE